MNKKPNLFNQVIMSSIEDYKNKIETLTKQKERLIRRDKRHREEIESLHSIMKEVRELLNQEWYSVLRKETITKVKEILDKVEENNK